MVLSVLMVVVNHGSGVGLLTERVRLTVRASFTPTIALTLNPATDHLESNRAWAKTCVFPPSSSDCPSPSSSEPAAWCRVVVAST